MERRQFSRRTRRQKGVGIGQLLWIADGATVRTDIYGSVVLRDDHLGA